MPTLPASQSLHHSFVLHGTGLSCHGTKAWVRQTVPRTVHWTVRRKQLPILPRHLAVTTETTATEYAVRTYYCDYSTIWLNFNYLIVLLGILLLCSICICRAKCLETSRYTDNSGQWAWKPFIRGHVLCSSLCSSLVCLLCNFTRLVLYCMYTFLCRLWFPLKLLAAIQLHCISHENNSKLRWVRLVQQKKGVMRFKPASGTTRLATRSRLPVATSWIPPSTCTLVHTDCNQMALPCII